MNGDRGKAAACCCLVLLVAFSLIHAMCPTCCLMREQKATRMRMRMRMGMQMQRRARWPSRAPRREREECRMGREGKGRRVRMRLA